MEFRGWVTDYYESSFQGIIDDEVTKPLSALERMVPQQAQKWIEWDQTKKEQGTWPRKIMVSTWFKHETNLVTMIDLLKIMKEELEKTAHKINGQNVKAMLEVSPQRRPLTKAGALFSQGLKEVGADESKVRACHGNVRYLSLWEEILLPKMHARTKVTRKKVGSSTYMLCQQYVQISTTLFLKRW